MSRLRGNGKINKTSNIEETANDNHARKLCSTTYMHQFYEEFFKIYLAEREETHELIKQENGQTRRLMKELITTIKDKSSQTRISQLETSTMIFNKLDACHCDSKKLAKKTLSQMNRPIYFTDIISNKDSKNFTI